MYQALYDLLLQGVFGGQLPSSLSAYLLEFFCIICIFLIVGMPFFIVYGFVRRVF